MTTPALAVVVPTRDRPDALDACLRALADRRRPDPTAVEVVVVDDGSRDRAAVAAVVAGHADARLVPGPGAGPARARNLGAAATDAVTVCFTDDDCRPVPGWVHALGRAVGATAAAAGPTENGRPDDVYSAAAQTVTNHLTEWSLDPDGRRVGFAPTCNLAVDHATFETIPFDEDFPLAAGEDRDWCARWAAAGHALAFVPEARVHHHQDLSLVRFWRQQHRYGRGAHTLRTRGHAGGRAPARFYTGLVAKGIRQGPAVGALVGLAQVATVAGLAGEAIATRSGLEKR